MCFSSGHGRPGHAVSRRRPGRATASSARDRRDGWQAAGQARHTGQVGRRAVLPVPGCSVQLLLCVCVTRAVTLIAVDYCYKSLRSVSFCIAFGAWRTMAPVDYCYKSLRYVSICIALWSVTYDGRCGLFFNSLRYVSSCRALCSVTHAVTLACTDCLDNSQYMVYTNKLAFIIDLFLYRYKVSWQAADPKRPCTVHTQQYPFSIVRQGTHSHSPRDGFQNFCVADTTAPQAADVKEQDSSRRPGDSVASALLGLLASVLQCFATASPEVKESAASVQRMVDVLRCVDGLSKIQ